MLFSNLTVSNLHRRTRSSFGTIYFDFSCLRYACLIKPEIVRNPIPIINLYSLNGLFGTKSVKAIVRIVNHAIQTIETIIRMILFIYINVVSSLALLFSNKSNFGSIKHFLVIVYSDSTYDNHCQIV